MWCILIQVDRESIPNNLSLYKYNSGYAYLCTAFAYLQEYYTIGQSNPYAINAI